MKKYENFFWFSIISLLLFLLSIASIDTILKIISILNDTNNDKSLNEYIVVSLFTFFAVVIWTYLWTNMKYYEKKCVEDWEKIRRK